MQLALSDWAGEPKLLQSTQILAHRPSQNKPREEGCYEEGFRALACACLGTVDSSGLNGGTPRRAAGCGGTGASSASTRAPNSTPQAEHAFRRRATEIKRIFEPISYPEDLKFTDVFFVNRDMGWAVGGTARGAGGMVLYTNDGGDHWSVNLGDPQSNAAAYSELRFIDARHGWMAQGNDQLLRTVDGQNWEVVGKIPDYYYDYL